MRAIIIDDKDAVALVDSLQLTKLKETHKYSKVLSNQDINDLHRVFHYEVVKWLQAQGARVTP